MTREQIARSLDRSAQWVFDAFQMAQREHPELKETTERTMDPQHNKGADYTLDEVYLAMSYARDGKGISDFEKEILRDDFSMRPPKKLKAIGIKGTEEFLEKVKNFPKKKCCSTCVFCTKMTMRNRKPVMRPYCNFHHRFLHRINANPYMDWCKQWRYSNTEPLVFYTAESPKNVDLDGNPVKKIMGINFDKFNKAKEKRITLVTDIGIDMRDVPDI